MLYPVKYWNYDSEKNSWKLISPIQFFQCIISTFCIHLAFTKIISQGNAQAPESEVLIKFIDVSANICRPKESESFENIVGI